LIDEANVFKGRVLICAFEGWNDAAESASAAANIVSDSLDCIVAAEVDPEDYYDFQFTRPTVSLSENGDRELTWPTTSLLISSSKDPNLSRFSVLIGTEPARRWKSFVAEILEMIEDREIETVIFLGGMLADTPHTRPISVTATSQNEIVRKIDGVEKSNYEGPVGIVSTLGIALEEAGIATIALWAAVPHYVHTSPSPKATLALVAELERLLGVSFSHGDLADQAFAWERGIDEIAENDEEMSGYIEQLEASRDEVDSEAASGEAIARELEKFLQSEQRPPEA
jgi:hypothetical protein